MFPHFFLKLHLGGEETLPARSSPIRSPADRVLFMVFGTNQLVDQSLVGALETSGIYKLFQRFTYIIFMSGVFCRVLAKEHTCFFKNEMNKLFIEYIYIYTYTHCNYTLSKINSKALRC